MVKISVIKLSIRSIIVISLLVFSVKGHSKDGSVDSLFDAGLLEKVGGSVIVFEVQANGKILIGGKFNRVGGHFSQGVARLNSDGTIDTSFRASVDGLVSTVALQDDGKIVVGGRFKRTGDVSMPSIARLQSNGELDPDFNPPISSSGVAGNRVTTALVLPDRRILLGGLFAFDELSPFTSRFVLFKSDGRLDTSNDSVNELAMTLEPVKLLNAPENKIILLGDGAVGFPSRLLRLNSDLTVDTNFSNINPSEQISVIESPIFEGFSLSNAIAIDSHGRILVSITTRGSLGPPNDRIHELVRFMPDGALDSTFSPFGIGGFGSGAGFRVSDIVIDDTGKIIVTRIEKASKLESRITTISDSGDIESDLALPDSRVLTITPSPISDFWIGGEFRQLFNRPVMNLGAVYLDDRQELSKTVGMFEVFGASIKAMDTQYDGRIIVGGDFSRIGGIQRSNLARLETNGKVDLDFISNANAEVTAIAVQDNGKIVIGGAFDSIAGADRNKLARLSVNGSIDSNFLAQISNDENGSARIMSIAFQDDDRILIGGNFDGVSGYSVTNLARLSVAGLV